MGVLQDNLTALISILRLRGIDFHLGVTTTGLDPGGDCPGGVGGGEDGRLFPVTGDTPRILTEDTPDLDAAWSANLYVGACREGPSRALEAAVRALTPPVENSSDDPRHPEENDGNAGFLRPDAFLSVVVVADRDDKSLMPVTHYYEELLSLKGWRNTHLFGFHAIAGDRVTGCAGDGRTAAPADRLLSLVEQTGGSFQSICDPDWMGMFKEFKQQAIRPTCFGLSQPPSDMNGDGLIDDTEGELEVVVNGLVLPSRGDSSMPVWLYRPEEGALCIYFLAPESTVEARYRAGCG